MKALLLIATLVSPALWALPYTRVCGVSHLQFVGKQQGEAFTGEFKEFYGVIDFDPLKLATSKLNINIDLRSVGSKSPDRDSALATAAWFDTGKTPIANFVTTQIKAVDKTHYLADATLQIKTYKKPVKFSFSFVTDPKGARLIGTAKLNRLDFALGAGEWADASVIGHDVDVKVDLVLRSGLAKATCVR
jgi:polyisoprenoid-binding protein YceI